MRLCPHVWILLAAGCGAGSDPGTRAVFDLASAHDTPATFWDLPFPLDGRVTPAGAPDLTGFYSKGDNSLGEHLVVAAGLRRGFPQMPVVYFRFDGPLAERDAGQVIPADLGSPILLIDIDDESPDRGLLSPVVAAPVSEDDFAPAHLLAVAPRPGIVLRGDTRYAVVLMRSLADAGGERLGVPDDLAGAEVLAPLWPALEELGVAREEVAAATVFTTGDVVADFAAMSDELLERQRAELSAPVLDEVHPDYCELALELTLPQFLSGNEPWNRGGVFELGPDGIPVAQGERTVPAVITVPRRAMPAGGFPLLLYFHGSGGVHDQVVDASRSPAPEVAGPPGEGPAMHYARIGLAAAGSALPVSPDRVPGASDTAYINFNNLGAFPFLFRQGTIEQRMFLSALEELDIPLEVLAGCDGVEAEGGVVSFDSGQIYLGGQSMGAIYANMVGAVDPRPRAVVPTGAGGAWSLMILSSRLYADQVDLLRLLLGTENQLSWLHPGMHTITLAWEAAEPLVYAARLGRRPLAGRAPRPVYQPVGRDDRYFAPPVFDAITLAYGHQESGEVVWPEMQEALALVGLDGLRDYPVVGNLTSESGEPYTGVVVQYEGDGIADPHAIYRQLDEVIYQYTCFLETMIDSGRAVVAAPAPLGTPCPAPALPRPPTPR